MLAGAMFLLAGCVSQQKGKGPEGLPTFQKSVDNRQVYR